MMQCLPRRLDNFTCVGLAVLSKARPRRSWPHGDHRRILGQKPWTDSGVLDERHGLRENHYITYVLSLEWGKSVLFASLWII